MGRGKRGLLEDQLRSTQASENGYPSRSTRYSDSAEGKQRIRGAASITCALVSRRTASGSWRPSAEPSRTCRNFPANRGGTNIVIGSCERGETSEKSVTGVRFCAAHSPFSPLVGTAS